MHNLHIVDIISFLGNYVRFRLKGNPKKRSCIEKRIIPFVKCLVLAEFL